MKPFRLHSCLFVRYFWINPSSKHSLSIFYETLLRYLLDPLNQGAKIKVTKGRPLRSLIEIYGSGISLVFSYPPVGLESIECDFVL